MGSWAAMQSGTWANFAAQSCVHALLAALAAEALIGLWRARAPSDRLLLRLAALAQPLLVTPALFALFPDRRSEDFRFALLSLRNLDDLRIGPLGLVAVGLWLGAALSLALLVTDLWPLLARGRGPPEALPPPPPLEAALAEVARRVGLPAPALSFVRSKTPTLFCAGMRRRVLVVSEGALELLDPAELRAALGHELAHLERHDPALSWALALVRLVLFFNPVVQVVARAVARDAEWRADEGAGADRLALASAVLKLHRAGLSAHPRFGLPLAARLAEPLRRARSHDVAARCRRLLEPAPPSLMPWRSARVTLAVASFAALAFAVT
jgi:Zn-dependent protease with chaperone function